MHKGRLYPLDQRLRIYPVNFSYPTWFPQDGYTGFVSTYQSTDWSSTILFSGPWTLTGWSYGDRSLSYECPPVLMNGRTVECKYHWALNTAGTVLTGNLDLYVDGVQQVRSTPSTTPPSSPSPANYFESFQFAAPATPFRCQVSACVLDRVGY